MHRVVNLTSVGNDATAISGHKTHIQDMLFGYDLYSSEVNDGQNTDGDPTLGVNADFNDAGQANAFHGDLQAYIQDNASDFNSARTRIHDCMHASGQNLPCAIGDVWSL